MKKLRSVLAAFCCCASIMGQNLLLNGGFESPGLGANEGARALADGSTLISGWTVIDDAIGEKPVYAKRPNSDAVIAGDYGLILNQGSGLKTTFRAEPGSFYQLAFWVRPGDCPQCVSPAPLRVVISGQGYRVPLVAGWSQQTIQFWATNSLNTLEIVNPSSPADFKQFGLDDVSITKLKGAVLNIRMYPGVLIEGFPGERYEIQATTDLNAPNWVTVTNILMTNSPVLFIDSDPKRPLDYPPKDRRVYRAIQVAP